MVRGRADVASLPVLERIQQYVYTGDSNGSSYAHGHHCIIIEAVDTHLPYPQKQSAVVLHVSMMGFF